VTVLFDVSSARAGTLALTLAPCDLGTLVREQVAAQQANTPGRTIALDLPDQPVVVVADADRLGQVLTNYLSNAVKYSAEDRPVAVRLEVADGLATVSVRDRGPGLPAAELPRVWELYHRAPGVAVQSDTGGIGGSLGLGLHVCKRLIELHPGGQVGVESVVGQGSAFWFRLPVAGDLATNASHAPAS
jgi:signal transduction histidine kinase